MYTFFELSKDAKMKNKNRLVLISFCLLIVRQKKTYPLYSQILPFASDHIPWSNHLKHHAAVRPRRLLFANDQNRLLANVVFEGWLPILATNHSHISLPKFPLYCLWP